MRRPGLNTTDTSIVIDKPSKRRRCSRADETIVLNRDTDESSYKKNIELLIKEHQKPKKNSKSIRSLMKTTHSHRRQWILREHPLVQEVVKVCPGIKSAKYVSCLIIFIMVYLQLRYEMCLTLGIESTTPLLDNWEKIVKQVIDYAKLE